MKGGGIGRIVRRWLDDGHTVEIDGLGSFRGRSEAGLRFSPQIGAQVFVAYAVEDLALARRLCKSLREAGFCPWLDKEKLLPGQNWPRAIERAIDISDAFVACFSHRSILKRGQFQCELRYAFDCARRRPLDATFLIPVRLDPCTIPRRIAGEIHYVDMFPDWERGAERVVRAIRKASPTRPSYLFNAKI